MESTTGNLVHLEEYVDSNFNVILCFNSNVILWFNFDLILWFNFNVILWFTLNCLAIVSLPHEIQRNLTMIKEHDALVQGKFN